MNLFVDGAMWSALCNEFAGGRTAILHAIGYGLMETFVHVLIMNVHQTADRSCYAFRKSD